MSISGTISIYYQLHNKSALSVAVSDTPAGPYEFYGHVRHADGSLYGSRKGDAYAFDPGILVDEDGKVYLYVGFSPADRRFRLAMKLFMHGEVDGGYVVRLKSDMLTISGKQCETVPGELEASENYSEFAGHAFFEASSPRKIRGLYYLVYSSSQSHELCYATSHTPTGPWSYGGTIVSIGDIGLPGVSLKRSRNFTGNTHGGLVCVNGQWYIFYHRQTNQQKCARQGCAEKVRILPDGSIPQAEITSCGLNGAPLAGIGRYDARIACNLRGRSGTYAYTQTHHKESEYPYFTQDGPDMSAEEAAGNPVPAQYIANMKDRSVAGFKYFDFDSCRPSRISVTLRGPGSGVLAVKTSPGSGKAALIPFHASDSWTSYSADLAELKGVKALYFCRTGKGSIDFLDFTLE